MKLRENFVANSSSSSFTIITSEEKDLSIVCVNNGTDLFINHISNEEEYYKFTSKEDLLNYIKRHSVFNRICNKIEEDENGNIIFVFSTDIETVSDVLTKMQSYRLKQDFNEDYWDISADTLYSLLKSSDIVYQEYIYNHISDLFRYEKIWEYWNNIYVHLKPYLEKGQIIYLVEMRRDGDAPSSDLEDELSKMSSEQLKKFLKDNAFIVDEIYKEYL